MDPNFFTMPKDPNFSKDFFRSFCLDMLTDTKFPASASQLVNNRFGELSGSNKKGYFSRILVPSEVINSTVQDEVEARMKKFDEIGNRLAICTFFNMTSDEIYPVGARVEKGFIHTGLFYFGFLRKDGKGVDVSVLVNVNAATTLLNFRIGFLSILLTIISLLA
jgi:hypothetical protein